MSVANQLSSRQLQINRGTSSPDHKRHGNSHRIADRRGSPEFQIHHKLSPIDGLTAMNSADRNREVIRSQILVSQQINSDAVTIT